MTGVPATTRMHWRIGSMAIPYVTTLLLQLQDRGKLSLDDPVSKWLPNPPPLLSLPLPSLGEPRLRGPPPVPAWGAAPPTRSRGSPRPGRAPLARLLSSACCAVTAARGGWRAVFAARAHPHGHLATPLAPPVLHASARPPAGPGVDLLAPRGRRRRGHDAPRDGRAAPASGRPAPVAGLSRLISPPPGITGVRLTSARLVVALVVVRTRPRGYVGSRPICRRDHVVIGAPRPLTDGPHWPPRCSRIGAYLAPRRAALPP